MTAAAKKNKKTRKKRKEKENEKRQRQPLSSPKQEHETPEEGYQNLHEMIDSVKDYEFTAATREEPSDEEIREYERSKWLAKQESKYGCGMRGSSSSNSSEAHVAAAAAKAQFAQGSYLQETLKAVMSSYLRNHL